MKKLHLTFGILAGGMTLAAIMIALIWFVYIANIPYTSFPAAAAFMIVGVFYAMGIAVVGLAWLIAWLILRRRTCTK